MTSANASGPAFPREVPVAAATELIAELRSGSPRVLRVVQLASWCAGCVAALLSDQQQDGVFGATASPEVNMPSEELAAALEAELPRPAADGVCASPVVTGWLMRLLVEIALRAASQRL